VRENDRCEKLQKALEAGGGDVAPSAAVQGAALARSWKNKAMAVYREWDGDGELREVLKNKLPEASEEFIGHFADLVDEFKLGKLKKGEKPKAPKKATPAQEPEPVKPVQQFDWSDAKFDSKRGVLHSNGRKFPISIPTDGTYGEALNQPHVKEVHGRAMHNWSIVHKLLAKGRVLPGILSAAAINAGFSSNTSVPLQELAFGHFKDLGNEGHDVLSGPFTPEQEQTLRAKFQSRVLPKWMREWYQKHPEGIVSKDGTVRVVGLQDDKIDAANFYHRIHPMLHELLDTHGADGQAIARAMIQFKHQYDLWKSRARVAAAKDGRTLTREDRLAHDGPVVEQLAVKTLRYAIAMLGAGNMIVPDTHFIRHFFGLPIKHPDNDFIKATLLDPRNAHILDQMDEYHRQHHPAAKAVRQWYFNGKDHPMVTFPAFWLHWLSIAAHDTLRGVPGAGLAHHGNTAHDPFFNAAAEAMREFGVPGHDKIVIKNEGPHSLPLPFRCALACEKLRRDHGEGAAQVAFWAYMAPLLHDVEAEHLVAKFEGLRDVLLAKADKLREPEVMTFNGHSVRPGEAEGLGSNVKGRYHVLHRDQQHVYVMPKGGGLGQLQKWPLDREGTHFRVISNPVPADSLKVDAAAHGLPEFMRHSEQSKLIHGMDLSGGPDNRPAFFRPGTEMFSSAWWKTAKGTPGYMKVEEQPLDLPYGREFGRVRRAALFHNMAHDYFGLGKYVPTTVALRHPRNGYEASIMDQIPDAEHADFTMKKDVGRVALPEHQKQKLAAVEASGDLHKLMMTDLIMGNDDRHGNNYMFTSDPAGIKLIDHDLTLNPKLDRIHPPGYMHHHYVSQASGTSDKPLHPAAQQWLQSLNPIKFIEEMRKHGVPEKLLLPSLLRLQWLQHHAAANPAMNVGDVIERAQDVNPERKLGEVIATLQR
jgi:hypothetical protein